MKIMIEFPQVMKMLMTTTLDVPDAASLKEIKERVLASFWKTFTFHFVPKIGVHGTLENIILKDREIEISTEDILRDLLKRHNCFQAIFSTGFDHASK